MAGANSNIQVTALDFNAIKNNLQTFLQSQTVLKDYNFQGSALSVLLDLLAYNTQYNAYYLNMVSNEMFLDTALLRQSVISHAKLLDYTPQSAIAPAATINLVVNQVSDSSLTLPTYTTFLSEAIDGVNYKFVTVDTHTVNTTANTVYFNNIEIKQGTPATLTFTVDTTANPNCVFALTDTGIDTTSLQVTVQQSSSNGAIQVFNRSTDFLTLTSTSQVYFLQESISIPETYEIYFGDGILGTQLSDGNIVTISYIVTRGSAASGANNFVLMQPISGYSNTVVYPVVAASKGGDIESIQSIQYQAPKAYATQGRAVTTDDYITLIQQNNLGISFDAVSVWGGQQNNPPAYGQVFISLKPSGAYALTDTQKQLLINQVIDPISVITVSPTIVDPDYVYIVITSNIIYNQKRTNNTASQIQAAVVAAIQNFGSSTLNTFNSLFSISDLSVAVQNADPSIVANENIIRLEKKFNPTLGTSQAYTLYYGTPLQKGILQSGVSSSPALQFRDPVTPSKIIDGVYIEEIPSSTGGIQSITIINAGFNYLYPPRVTILGDGSGATAVATITPNGTLNSITVTNAGSNYTQAVISITPLNNDTTGTNGAAVAILEGQYGTLRTYYYNTQGVKTILNPNVGTIDYVNGIINLNSFGPYNVDNPLGQLTITANPVTSIISSGLNRILTVDPNDNSAITVNVTVQS